MKIIALGRQEGKTWLCIDYLKEHPKVHMIAPTQIMARRQMEATPEVKGRVHSIHDVLRMSTALKNIEAFVMDDADQCLEALLGKVVRMITFTTDSADTLL